MNKELINSIGSWIFVIFWGLVLASCATVVGVVSSPKYGIYTVLIMVVTIAVVWMMTYGN